MIGAGLMGAASAWSLSRRGRSVLLAEQFAPGHRRGSSHGSARIVRRAYGDALYTRLTGQAFELWRELEIASGVRLLRMLGGLDFGAGRGVAAVAEHLTTTRVAHDVLPAAEAETRWPGMRFEGAVVFHPQAGTLDADAAVASFVDQAGRHGAQVSYEKAVTGVRPAGERSDVEFADGTAVRARQVVVAAGPWAPPLLANLIDLPVLTVSEQDVLHFPRRDLSAAPWPSTIHAGERQVYHLAGGRDGGAGDDRKLGEHGSVRTTTASGRSGHVDPESRRRAIDYVRQWLPGLDPSPRSETTCLYTSTLSEDFVLDRVGPLVVCSPCSGHGAKFAPLIGEFVADLVTGIGAVPDRFRLAANHTGRGVSL